MAVQVSVVGSGVEHEANAEEVGRLLASRGATVVTGMPLSWLLRLRGVPPLPDALSRQAVLVAWRWRKLRAFSRLPQTSIEHQARERLRDLS